MRLRDVQHEEGMDCLTTVSCRLSKRDHQWLKDNRINLRYLVEAAINELREEE